jgi:hypothetical protein
MGSPDEPADHGLPAAGHPDLRAAPRKLSVTTFTATGRPSVQEMSPQSSVSLDVDGGVSLVDITM